MTQKVVRFYFRKLVPDKVVHYSVIDPEVKHVEFYTLSKEELIHELVKKIKEEVDEVPTDENASSADVAKEIADLRIAVDELSLQLGLTPKEVDRAILGKINHRGGVSKGHFVEYVDVPTDCRWAKLFREQPDKYIEEEL